MNEADRLAQEHWKFLNRWMKMAFTDGFTHGYKHGSENVLLDKSVTPTVTTKPQSEEPSIDKMVRQFDPKAFNKERE